MLHKDAGIIGRGGMDKEEVRAYLTEMAYGNPAFSFAYLPSKKINDPNCIAGRSIIEQIYNATDLASLLNASNKQLRALAVELLDREFLDCFGAHHDQIIPKLEIYRIKNHKFFNDEKLPMIESLRYLPKKKAA